MNHVMTLLAATALSLGLAGCSPQVRELKVAEYDAAADGGKA